MNNSSFLLYTVYIYIYSLRVRVQIMDTDCIRILLETLRTVLLFDCMCNKLAGFKLSSICFYS